MKPLHLLTFITLILLSTSALANVQKNETPLITPIIQAQDGAIGVPTTTAKWWQLFKPKSKNEKVLKGVHPDLRVKLEAVYDVMKERGYDMRPMEGMRSEARQAALLASNAGVTSVGAGMSCHNHGYAVDSVMHVNGKPTWNMHDPHVRDGYKLFGELVQAVDLEWGGNWTTLQDYPHVEMKTECRTAIRAKRTGQKAPAMVASVSEDTVQMMLYTYQNPAPTESQICGFDQPCEAVLMYAMMCPAKQQFPTWWTPFQYDMFGTGTV
ncbi:L-alanyl-D-glutamate peptidase [Stenotrophomonas maltophilia RA8]|jgi:hypothetical protein|uniref:M15 family metallopeptidase n=1 Tax=Stenotrophomonas maltophilia TaxID=40324 RepID=UPI0002C52D08|nr:M15 family metallopeptidase [Stenotrophomonas maltophilia]MBA0455270.1 M15 family peptidase [Stenotrophomonas maltophilia]MCD5965517.1 M15 family metallopeptidase [Stenotrophomonas maltophilia]QGL75347.1 M15 family metallopeptidase [Stenotrophomonas maltophilia]CCP15480.1 L-alanyl-D-glutamate peptidase [Stenotrophomonas maltophilia RA8]HEL2981940.1 M15 family metallopeptidase [Stenotrophomonas maltophilia]